MSFDSSSSKFLLNLWMQFSTKVNMHLIHFKQTHSVQRVRIIFCWNCFHQKIFILTSPAWSRISRFHSYPLRDWHPRRVSESLISSRPWKYGSGKGFFHTWLWKRKTSTMLDLFPTHIFTPLTKWVGKRYNIVEVFLFHNQVWKKPFPDSYFHGVDDMNDSETRRGCQPRREDEWNQEIRNQAGVRKNCQKMMKGIMILWMTVRRWPLLFSVPQWTLH